MHTYTDFEALVASACNFVVMDLGKSRLVSVTARGHEATATIEVDVVLRARDWDSQLRALQTLMNAEDNFEGEAVIIGRLVEATPDQTTLQADTAHQFASA